MQFPWKNLALLLGLVLAPGIASQAQTLAPSPQPAPQIKSLDATINANARRLLEKARQMPGHLACPTLSPDGRQLVFGHFNNYSMSVYAYTLTSTSRIKSVQLLSDKLPYWKKPDFTVGLVSAFSPDGKLFAVGKMGKGEDPTEDSIHLWDTRTWKKIGVLKGHPHTVTSLAFSPDGKQIISGNAGGGVIIHDVAGRKIVSAWCRNVLLQATAAFWKGDNQLVPIVALRGIGSGTGNDDQPKRITGCTYAPPLEAGALEIWNLATNERLKSFNLPREHIVNGPFNLIASFSASGQRLAFLSRADGANEYGNPFTITQVDWESDTYSETRVEADIYKTFGGWDTLQFLPSKLAPPNTLLFSDTENNKLSQIR